MSSPNELYKARLQKLGLGNPVSVASPTEEPSNRGGTSVLAPPSSSVLSGDPVGTLAPLVVNPNNVSLGGEIRPATINFRTQGVRVTEPDFKGSVSFQEAWAIVEENNEKDKTLPYSNVPLENGLEILVEALSKNKGVPVEEMGQSITGQIDPEMIPTGTRASESALVNVTRNAIKIGQNVLTDQRLVITYDDPVANAQAMTTPSNPLVPVTETTAEFDIKGVYNQAPAQLAAPSENNATLIGQNLPEPRVELEENPSQSSLTNNSFLSVMPVGGEVQDLRQLPADLKKAA